MWRWIKQLFGVAKPKTIRAAYDAAQTTEEHSRHWINADTLSAPAAQTSAVRTVLRSRSRYERENNGYASGLVQTLANDLIGSGPTLQAPPEVEAAWKTWCECVGLAELLHTAHQAKTTDGESFILLTTDRSQADPVKLSLDLIECDQVTTPPTSHEFWTMGAVDGIEFGPNKKPIAYHVLRQHPGDVGYAGFLTWGEYDRVPASRVVHWYRKDRPGQARGIPELTPALPLFAQLRRYTLATLTSAEIAANFSALLETEMAPDGTTTDPTPFQTLPIERGMMTTLPAGAKLSQFKAEQPTTQYGGFKTELLKEIGRPVNAPFNVVAGDSSPYNYSSARLDHLLYRGSVRVNREHCRRNVVERIFAAWYAEARFEYRWAAESVEHTWYWPGFQSIDPWKEANADAQNLENGTTTVKELLAEYGQDWVVFIQQRAKELAMMRKLGVVPEMKRDSEEDKPEPEEEEGLVKDAKRPVA